MHLSERRLCQARGARKPSASRGGGRGEAAAELQTRAGARRQSCRCAVVCVRSDCSLLALAGFLPRMLKPVTAKKKNYEHDKPE